MLGNGGRHTSRDLAKLEWIKWMMTYARNERSSRQHQRRRELANHGLSLLKLFGHAPDDDDVIVGDATRSLLAAGDDVSRSASVTSRRPRDKRLFGFIHCTGWGSSCFSYDSNANKQAKPAPQPQQQPPPPPPSTPQATVVAQPSSSNRNQQSADRTSITVAEEGDTQLITEHTQPLSQTRRRQQNGPRAPATATVSASKTPTRAKAS